MSGQLKIHLPPTPLDKVLEGLGATLLIILWVYVITGYQNLPETIPTHFNAAGQPDDFGSKSTIFLIPGVVTAISILFFILQFYPHKFNYPVRKITHANAEFQYRNTILMMRFLKIGMLIFFFLIAREIINSAKGSSSTMGPYFWIWLVLLIFAPIGIFLVRALRNK